MPIELMKIFPPKISSVVKRNRYAGMIFPFFLNLIAPSPQNHWYIK